MRFQLRTINQLSGNNFSNETQALEFLKSEIKRMTGFTWEGLMHHTVYYYFQLTGQIKEYNKLNNDERIAKNKGMNLREFLGTADGNTLATMFGLHNSVDYSKGYRMIFLKGSDHKVILYSRTKGRLVTFQRFHLSPKQKLKCDMVFETYDDKHRIMEIIGNNRKYLWYKTEYAEFGASTKEQRYKPYIKSISVEHCTKILSIFKKERLSPFDIEIEL